MRAVPYLAFVLLASCNGTPKGPTEEKDLNQANAAMPEDDRISILETRVSELETRLASEKVTREQIDKELANSIAEVGEARLHQPPQPAPQNIPAR